MVTSTDTDTVDRNFPFTIGDLKYWVVRRKDGAVIKYVLRENDPPGVLPPVSHVLPKHGSLSAWCTHDSTALPAFSYQTEKGALEIRICDSSGVKKAFTAGQDDLIVDAGDVLLAYAVQPVLTGTAQDLIDDLSCYADTGRPDVLKIKWSDREAPDLHPQFWIDFAERLKERARESDPLPYRMMINCQGGHGRSGTGLVCLMMCLSDYNALDAITHLRAIHCPRAIESVTQHEYIDVLASYLGRTANAKEALQGVTNFKERFLSLTCETSRPYRERLSK